MPLYRTTETLTPQERASCAVRAITAHQRAWCRRVIPDLCVGLMYARDVWRRRALAAEAEVRRLQAGRLVRDTEPCSCLPDSEEGGL